MTRLPGALLLLVLAMTAMADADIVIREFDPGSMRAIEKAYSGSPFIVAVWATDCPPCRHELALLSTFSRQNPDVPVVLIATDGRNNADGVVEVLASHGLHAVESWNFGEAGADRLRHSIDPQWYGEMPRSYLYEASGERSGISGALTEDLLITWISN